MKFGHLNITGSVLPPVKFRLKSVTNGILWHKIALSLEVAWRNGRVSGSHSGDPGSIPGRGNPKPPRVDQALHPSVVDKIGT